jgi:hypothetical protein
LDSSLITKAATLFTTFTYSPGEEKAVECQENNLNSEIVFWSPKVEAKKQKQCFEAKKFKQNRGKRVLKQKSEKNVLKRKGRSKIMRKSVFWVEAKRLQWYCEKIKAKRCEMLQKNFVSQK